MHSITNLCVLILEQTNEIRSSQEKKLKIVFVLRFYMAIKPKKTLKLTYNTTETQHSLLPLIKILICKNFEFSGRQKSPYPDNDKK